MTERLSDILVGIETGPAKAVRVCQLLGLWERVVDERVGRQTEAVKISHRTLYVSTASPAWAQELTFLKQGIIEKFNALAGREEIRDIKFKTGGYHG